MLQLHSILPQTLTEFYHENLILEQLGEFYRCNPMLVTSCCILGLLYIYYSLRVAGVPELHCRRGTSLHRLLTSLPLVRAQYRPTFWCWESRLQSILVACVRDLAIPRIHYTRTIRTLADGGEVAVDWEHGSADTARDSETPIVVILPGITGSSQSDYCKALVNIIRDQVGARVAVFNFRGRGGVKVKSPRTYCAANSEDLSEILDYINSTFPRAPVVALGVSLGGIILGNYLAEKGESARSKLHAAVLISVCFDTFEGTKSLETPGLNRLLNRHLATRLVATIKEVKEHFDNNKRWNLEQVFSSTTVREFDISLTTKMFGYKDVYEYYADARLYDKVESIKVPTLAINAADDPFQPDDSLPKEAAAVSSHVALLTTRYGGHVGWMEGWVPVSGYYWSDRLVASFLQQALSSPGRLTEGQ